MSDPESAPIDAPTRSSTDPWDVLLVVLGAVGMLVGVVGAVAALGLFLSSDMDQTGVLIAAALLSLGLLGLPAMVIGLFGAPELGRGWGLALLIGSVVMYPLWLALGHQAFDTGTLPAWIGTAAHVLAVASPTVFVVALVSLRGPSIPVRRRWGHFISGAWIAPVLSFGFELLALIPLALGVLAALSFDSNIAQLVERLTSASEAEMLELLQQLLLRPGVLAVAAVFIAGLVPLIEESLKSLVVWPVLPLHLTGAQAFLGGAIGGAGFAFAESLFLFQAGQPWLATMIARTATPLLHGFNTGLVCLGLVAALQWKQPGKLFGLFAAAVVLHGVWNLLAVGVGIAGFGTEVGLPLLSPGALDAIGYLGVLGLSMLAGVSLVGLIALPASLDRP